MTYILSFRALLSILFPSPGGRGGKGGGKGGDVKINMTLGMGHLPLDGRRLRLLCSLIYKSERLGGRTGQSQSAHLSDITNFQDNQYLTS
jgi:hypothetical protein